MATQTTNYNLTKIDLADSPPDITILNPNFDTIDSKLKEVENKANSAPVDSVNDAAIGNRTPDQTKAPATPGTGTLTNILSWLANRITAITGKTNWWDAPATTLQAASTHASGTSVHSATSAATASRIMMRDASGRAKVAAPSAVDDIARKDTVDNHINSSTAHPAANISVADAGSIFTATNVEGCLSELFTSASNGKNAIASAITGKGGIASGSDTFAQLATEIGNLSTLKIKSIQSGSVTGINSAAGTRTITPVNISSVDVSKSIIFVEAVCSSALALTYNTVAPIFNSSTQIALVTRIGHPAVIVYWTVVEFEGDMSVQTILDTMYDVTAAPYTKVSTISAVDMAKTFLVSNCAVATNTMTNLARVELTSTTTIKATANAYYLDYSVFVITLG